MDITEILFSISLEVMPDKFSRKGVDARAKKRVKECLEGPL